MIRRARSPAKGFYSLPGGQVEFGEIAAYGAAPRGRRGDWARGSRLLRLAGWREVLPRSRPAASII